MLKTAARSDELQKNKPLSVEVGGIKILLVRTDTGLYAVEDRCPHQSRSLETGTPSGATLTCRYHGVGVDLTSGEVAYDAGYLGLEPIATYRVVEEDGEIRVEIPSSG